MSINELTIEEITRVSGADVNDRWDKDGYYGGVCYAPSPEPEPWWEFW